MLAGSCEFQLVLMSAPCCEEKVRHVEVAVDDGEGERHVEYMLRRRRVPMDVLRARGVVAG